MRIWTNIQKRLFCNLLLVAYLVMVFTGCSTLPWTPPEELLRSRVDAMMEAKVREEWDQVYGYLDSAYRKKTSENAFLNIKRDMVFRNFSIESIEMTPAGNEADVAVKYDMTIKVFDFTDQMETQRWIKEGRNWYLKIEN